MLIDDCFIGCHGCFLYGRKSSFILKRKYTDENNLSVSTHSRIITPTFKKSNYFFCSKCLNRISLFYEEIKKLKQIPHNYTFSLNTKFNLINNTEWCNYCDANKNNLFKIDNFFICLDCFEPAVKYNDNLMFI